MTPSRFTRAALLALAAASSPLLFAGCIESPQTEVTYEAEARASLARTFEVGGVTVRLSRAELAFGPVYLCAASSGSATLCRSALGELLDVTRVDLLAGAPTPLGRVRGFTGSVRSASYDLGLHWFDTSYAVEAAPTAPDGHSLVVVGTLERAGEPEVPFRLLLDAVPQYQGQRAVPTAEAVAEITTTPTRLVVTFDPEAWLRQIDFDAVLKTAPRPIVLDTKSPAHDAALLGLKVARPPELRWITP
ncbi:MAG TPA: hypothetical protein PLR99_14955 [Polyangiaceae bacterium]|nr:hypothetical protein [Polyangiaceae bacterium]